MCPRGEGNRHFFSYLGSNHSESGSSARSFLAMKGNQGIVRNPFVPQKFTKPTRCDGCCLVLPLRLTTQPQPLAPAAEK